MQTLHWRYLLVILMLFASLSGCEAQRAQPSSDAGLGAGPPNPEPARVVKIETGEAGVYQLPLSEIRGLGLPVDDPLAGLTLVNGGSPQPFWIEKTGAGESLIFYARAVEGVYTAHNVYWLGQGDAWVDRLGSIPAGVRIVEDHPGEGVNLPPDTYWKHLRLEENLAYNPQIVAGDQGSTDAWYWVSLPAPARHTAEFHLSDPAPGPARVRIQVWAATEAPEPVDHHLVVSVNGAFAGEDRWDGRGWHTLELALPEGMLAAGRNEITIEAPGDTGAAADVSSLDRVEISYPSRLVAEEDALEFTSQGGEHHVAGFSGAVLGFDITEPSRVEKLDLAGEGEARFTGEAGHRYVLVGPRCYRPPLSVSLARLSPALRQDPPAADYLAIGPEELLAPLEPLLELRRRDGLSTAAVPLEAVYDQFGAGFPHPQAVRLFLKHLAAARQVPPEYLLLVGDASYDPLGYISPPEQNRLPAFFVDTAHGGETASDLAYAQLDEDGLPDLALGRIPAQTPDQVKVYVDKVLAHENASAGGKLQVLAVADGQEAYFSRDARQFLDLLPDEVQPDLYAPQPGVSNPAGEILSRLAQNPDLVAYFGHGSINMWGKDRLFTNEDIARLPKGERLPVVFSFTCLNGLFTHPKAVSMAEAWLFQPASGAVAVLAPTSLTLARDQAMLYNPLVRRLADDPGISLGKALLSAQQGLASAAGPDGEDVLLTFLFFGDPALNLR